MFDILFHGRKGQGEGLELRWWFWGFVLYLGVLAAGAMGSLHLYGQSGDEVWQKIWLVQMYLFYMSLCCTFFPAPTAWLVLLMASPVTALVPLGLWGISSGAAQAAFTIGLVALIGALGTAAANVNEYHLFTFLFRFGQVSRFRQTKWYDVAQRWFRVSPFTLLTAVSFLPLPVDVVRWLAISSQYRRDRYAAAYFLGRFLRYAILAATATCLQMGWREIAILQGVLIGAVVLRYIPRLLNRKRMELAAECVRTEGS